MPVFLSIGVFRLALKARRGNVCSLIIPLLFAATAAGGAIPTPPRPVTDPATVSSATNAGARQIPIEDLSFSRRLGPAIWSADGKSIFLVTNLTGRMNIWRMEADGSFPVQLTQSDDVQTGLVAAPDGRSLYYAQDRDGNEMHDLYAIPVDGGAPVDLTNTPSQREIGAVISRDGRMLAFSTKPIKAAQEDLAVMDLALRAVRPLTREADPQRRWTAVAWVDSNRALIANRSNADDTETEIWRIDVATGRAARLLGKPGTVYQAGDASRDGRMIALASNEGTGQLHAGLLDAATGRIRWLAPTPWEQTPILFSPDGANMLVQTSADGRIELSLVDTTTLAERSLELPPGVNNAAGARPFSPDGRSLLLSHSAGNAPVELVRADVASGHTAPVARFAMASLDPRILPPSLVVTYRSFDETLVSAILTVPFNLKRDGSNPAVLVAHGGPTSQAADEFSPIATALASRGYFVIQPNPRGSSGYGKAFQTANFQDLGGADLKDEIAAKAFLVATGYVDPTRVGITGGSYGGFMALMAIGRAPGEFAAAVQRYGIINWRTMWEHSDALLQAYIRSLLGTPEKNRAVYDATSPLTYISKARAPLLSLQGENDIRVPSEQAAEVTDALKANGNVADVVYYRAEGHGFQKRENIDDSLRRTVDWFDRYLKGGK